MAAMTTDELLLLTADEMDYGELDLELLRRFAVQDEEPFIATNALGELKRRHAPETQDAAEAILAKDHADRHLVAFAILMLFGVDVRRAVELGTVMVPRTMDPEVLGAFIEGALGEADALTDAPGDALIAVLLEQARRVPPGNYCDAGDWQRLFERFAEEVR